MKEIAATTKHFPPHRTLIWNLESLDVGEWHMIAGLSFAAQVITDGVVALEGTNELSFA